MFDPKRKQYPRNLGYLDKAEELASVDGVNMARDSMGRIRTPDGGYVCGVSGRVHRLRLFPWFDYEPEQNGMRRLWVDKEQLEAFGHGLVDQAEATAIDGASAFLQDGLRLALNIAMGALTKRIGL